MWKTIRSASITRVTFESVSDPLQVVLILLGAGVNFSLGFGLFASGIYALIASRGGVLLTSGIPTQVSILAIAYFVEGSLYSTVASLALRPKRIINPIFVQFVTASFVPILIFYLTVFYDPSISIPLAIFVAFVVFWLALAMFLSAGLGQFLLVRYLVGLNGSKGDTRSSSLILNASMKNVLAVLDSNAVRTAFVIQEQLSRKSNLRVFRTNPNTSEQYYLLVLEDPTDREKTQLATVAYRLDAFGIRAGNGDILDEMRLNELRQIFREDGISVLVGEASEALTIAYEYALGVTQTKLLSLRSSQPYLKAIAVGIVLMAGLSTTLWMLGIISVELFQTFVIFFSFALLFDFLPLLRKPKEEDFKGQ